MVNAVFAFHGFLQRFDHHAQSFRISGVAAQDSALIKTAAETSIKAEATPTISG